VLHAGPTIAAAEAGKHVVWEKRGRRVRVDRRVRGRRDRDDRGDPLRARPPNQLSFEINGSKGSLAFDLERLNELQVHVPDGREQGFRRVLVSEPEHPFWSHWWPPGHVLGWEHTFVHELHHLLAAIREDGDVEPHGATLRDGYRASEIADAVVRSSDTGARVEIAYLEV
jgi:predicted dehydrogenase